MYIFRKKKRVGWVGGHFLLLTPSPEVQYDLLMLNSCRNHMCKHRNPLPKMQRQYWGLLHP